MDSVAIKNFCDYLKIKTIQPNPDYNPAVEFIKLQAKELDLEFNVVELVEKNPIVYLKWTGKNPVLKSVVLNSHMDVVPVFLDYWKYDPFSAHIDESGNIFARGAQDMKCVGIQYLEAIRRIKSRDAQYLPERTIYVLFVPDEELGGHKGMLPFVQQDYLTKLNVGLVMDEGLASPTDDYAVFYGDRVCWWIRFIIKGSTGHGSRFLPNTAGEKLNILLQKCMEFREVEKQRLYSNCQLTLGDVTTINMTGCGGGVQHNVVPDRFTLDIDMRITPHASIDQIKLMLDQWIELAGGDIEMEFKQHAPQAYLTPVDESNPWWVAFEKVCQQMNMTIIPQVFPAGTDSRYIRETGVPAIGFSPMNNTPILLHDHNEFLNSKIFLQGIDFYEHLIPKLAAVVEL